MPRSPTGSRGIQSLTFSEIPSVYPQPLDSEGPDNHRPSPYLQQRFVSREADSDDSDLRHRRQPTPRQGSVLSDLGSESSYKTVKSNFHSNPGGCKVTNIQIRSFSLSLEISTSQIPTQPGPTSHSRMVSLPSRNVLVIKIYNFSAFSKSKWLSY